MGFGWIFLGAVAIIVVYSAIQFRKYRGSDRWPTVNGIIEGEPEMRSWDRGRSHYATVFYSYSVTGERYSGEWDTPSYPSVAKVRSFVAACVPAGSPVVVRYRTDDASVSMLEIDTASFADDGPIKLGI
jgi:hypothetical protein